MTYIRTENGIYELTNELGQTPIEIQLALTNGNYRQADTIEELCDEFVIVTPKNNKFIARKKMVDGKEYLLIDKSREVIELKNIKDYLVDLYGAIWVIDVNGAPTLKPVAKMNSEGSWN